MGDMKFFGSVVYDESVSNVTATPSVEIGARRFHKGEEYIYCYNAGGADIYPKYGVNLITGASGYSIANTGTTDTALPFVGVIKHSTIAAGSYGWVMNKGYAIVKHHTDSICTADFVAIALGREGTFHQARPVTDAVHVGTFAVVGHGLGVSVASGGTFYAAIEGRL